MCEEAMEENKRLLAFERQDDQEVEFPLSSKLRKLHFLSPPLYQELRCIYFICLHVIIVLLSIGLLLHSFQNQNVPDDNIYSK
jgi:hypothetical protein